MTTSKSSCRHTTLQLEPSAHAEQVGFERQDAGRRLAATTRTGRNPLVASSRGQTQPNIAEQSDAVAANMAHAFPGPLVLPNDDLALDPRQPPQSFRSWVSLKERNKPTRQRKTLYVAAVPEIMDEMRFMREWKVPRLGQKGNDSKMPPGETQSPNAENFVEYLKAFYYGFEVELFPQQLRFMPWLEEEEEEGMAKSKSKSKGKTKARTTANKPTYVGLATDDNCVRILARPSPDGIFTGQLNLDDILDATIDMIPDDAQAIILLVDHDMYEDEDDNFCCGRAYGGSRVAVVSTARYHPILDGFAEIDLAHMWPSSHCRAYTERVCGLKISQRPAAAKDGGELYPIRAAIAALSEKEHLLNQESISSSDKHHGLWFSRLCRTVSHELGHCFGMGHCVYYACCMQGTAGIAEDVRQPPYLCPVCLTKVTHASAGEVQLRDDSGKEEYVRERYETLVMFCRKWSHVGMFAAYEAWLRVRVNGLQNPLDILR